MKKSLRAKAIELRKKGLSYQEIKSIVPVSLSSLSLWLRSTSITPDQIKRLQLKKRECARKGAGIRKAMRIQEIFEYSQDGRKEVGSISKRDIYLIGIALYWAEGAKQKSNNVSQRVCFSNSDPKMVRIFLVWLDTICTVPLQDIIFELSIHHLANAQKALDYWRHELGMALDTQIAVRLKSHNPKTNRKNTGEKYHGLMRVTVRRSTALNRRIAGWIEGLTHGEWCSGNTSVFGTEDPRFES